VTHAAQALLLLFRRSCFGCPFWLPRSRLCGSRKDNFVGDGCSPNGHDHCVQMCPGKYRKNSTACCVIHTVNHSELSFRRLDIASQCIEGMRGGRVKHSEHWFRAPPSALYVVKCPIVQVGTEHVVSLIDIYRIYNRLQQCRYSSPARTEIRLNPRLGWYGSVPTARSWSPGRSSYPHPLLSWFVDSIFCVRVSRVSSFNLQFSASFNVTGAVASIACSSQSPGSHGCPHHIIYIYIC
jgi:hypothetical protein